MRVVAPLCCPRLRFTPDCWRPRSPAELQVQPLRCRRVSALGVRCSKRPGGGGSLGRPSSGDWDRDREKEKRDVKHQPYVVKLVTPPQRDLGLHCFPQNTQCGETIDIEGEYYIVSSVTYTYRLTRGKYTPGQKRLDVQSCGRYLYNLFLEDLMKK